MDSDSISMAVRAAASQSFWGPEGMGGAGCLLLAAFQVGEPSVVKLGDANEGQNVLSIALLVGEDFLQRDGDLGESLLVLGKSLLIVDLHGGDYFDGLGKSVQALVNRARFLGVCVVRHGEAASPVSIIASSRHRYCLSPASMFLFSLPAAQCATIEDGCSGSGTAPGGAHAIFLLPDRSEERRVGKECRCGPPPYH